MKASQLVKLLEESIKTYGDLPVNHSGSNGKDTPIKELALYDNRGESPQTSNNKPVEVYLH